MSSLVELASKNSNETPEFKEICISSTNGISTSLSVLDRDEVSYSLLKNDGTDKEEVQSKLQYKDDEYLCPCFPEREYLKIKKPLIPLKVSFFLWYGGGAIMMPFFNMYFIQLGLSVKQLSLILSLNPILQFIGPAISGIIADKTGRTKPVLVANLVLVGLVANSLLLVPPVNHKKCYVRETEISCVPRFSVKVKGMWAKSSYVCFTHCLFDEYSVSYFKLSGTHNEEGSFQINHTVYIPENLVDTFNGAELRKLPFSINFVNSSTFCSTYFVNDSCTTFCGNDPEVDGHWQVLSCPEVEGNENFVLWICLVISCLFTGFFSTCYRFLDVTSVSMVKLHDSDFGRERFWSIVSIAIMSPLAGYLVDLTTPEGAPRNCAFAFYFFDGLLILMMVAVYKLDVQINPPGKNMWRKAIKLSNNMNIAAFALTTLVLGTCWAFTKVFTFIYLDQLGSPSILMGLSLTVNSISGLPFLLTSNWWIKTLGSSNLLLLGLLGYVILGIGYSFLIDPWYALIYEMSAVFTYHLLWVAVVWHSHEIAPAGLTATIISCAGGIHYALGKGTSSLIGAFVMSRYGGRWAFRLIALICGVTAVIYGVYLHFRRKRIEKTADYSLQTTSLTDPSNIAG